MNGDVMASEQMRKVMVSDKEKKSWKEQKEAMVA